MTDINFQQTKDELARRNSQKTGISYQLTKQTIERREGRKKQDEQWAISIGEPLRYRDLPPWR